MTPDPSTFLEPEQCERCGRWVHRIISHFWTGELLCVPCYDDEAREEIAT